MVKGLVKATFIFKMGLAAGILFTIGFTFNVPTNQVDAAIFTLDQFYELELLDNQQTQYNYDEIKKW